MKLRVVCESLQKATGPNASFVTFRPVFDDASSDNAKVWTNQQSGALNLPIASPEQVDQFVLGATYDIGIDMVGSHGLVGQG